MFVQIELSKIILKRCITYRNYRLSVIINTDISEKCFLRGDKVKKYILEEYVINEYNASSKARDDMSNFVMQFGYNSIGRNDKTKIQNSNFKKSLLAMKLYLKIILSLGKDDIVFLQCSFKILDGLLKIKKIKGFKIIYLIHDVYSVKYSNPQEHLDEINKEMHYLSGCDYVICHNSIMRKRLEELGCTAELLELEIFDYMTEVDVPERKWKQTPSISFAGNMGKSPFLDALDEKLNKEALKVYAYGTPARQFNNIEYQGSVDAAILPMKIKGEYGLIWEGNYNISEQDNYMKYNNPHKASLYIVSGLPLIVWDKSAIADFVKKYGIGICISSLDELESKVLSISSQVYSEMVLSCLKLRDKLNSGYFINTVLKSIENKIGR